MLRIAVARVYPSDDDAPPAWLGDAERRRWAELSPASRREFVAGRGLLRELLGDATGVAPAAWDVGARAGTAPVARAPGSGDDAIHASLSHRLGWVAAAVADAPVGVDIELERPARTDIGERAALMLAPAELPAWSSLPAPEREGALLTRWTAKEAWFKASPAGAAPWDFRQVAARACDPAHANVRTWAAPPLHVALCAADPHALAAADCAGLAGANSFFWHVARA
jgi:phosphopantetheinyl transferase